MQPHLDQIIDLRWEAPLSLRELLSDAAVRSKYSTSGLYLMVETLKGRNYQKISYIGKATGRPTIVQRQLQHFVSTVGGQNQIPEWARSCGTRWECALTSPQVIDILFDKTRMLELVGEAYDYILSFQIHIALPPANADLHTLERNVIWELRPFDNTAGTKTPPSVRLPLRHHNAHWWTPVVMEQARPDVVVQGAEHSVA